MEGRRTPTTEKPAEATEKATSGEAKASDEGKITEVIKSPEGRPDIEITFLYAPHTSESAEKIWKKIEEIGAKTILLEQVGGDKGRAERNGNHLQCNLVGSSQSA